MHTKRGTEDTRGLRECPTRYDHKSSLQAPLVEFLSLIYKRLLTIDLDTSRKIQRRITKKRRKNIYLYIHIYIHICKRNPPVMTVYIYIYIYKV